MRISLYSTKVSTTLPTNSGSILNHPYRRRREALQRLVRRPNSSHGAVKPSSGGMTCRLIFYRLERRQIRSWRVRRNDSLQLQQEAATVIEDRAAHRFYGREI